MSRKRRQVFFTKTTLDRVKKIKVNCFLKKKKGKLLFKIQNDSTFKTASQMFLSSHLTLKKSILLNYRRVMQER